MRSCFLVTTLLLAAPVAAQPAGAPMATPLLDAIPAARDVPYPGTINLFVDATDTLRGVYKVRQSVPVAQTGRMTLLLPQWLPGNHAPRGALAAIAGLKIAGGGKPLRWTRDPVDVYAFHVEVPAGVTSLDIGFETLTPTAGDQGRVVMTQEMLNLQWEQVSLYPAGYYTRRIPVNASVRYPAGWQAATALRAAGPATDGVTRYGTVSYEVLQDSPVFAGKHFRREDLGHNVALNIVADEAHELAIAPEQLAMHRKLVDQAIKTFGARHFDHYDFLLSVSDRMGDIGLEHTRSSENGVDPGYFTDWAGSLPDHNLLPHEFTHSWNGKYRRPADLWTPDFRTPMRNSLLWVYEGMTQFWGYVLQARSGMGTKEQVLGAYANIAAGLDNLPAREWRSLDDTVNDPIVAARRPKPWLSYQRSEDYYNEGLLIWMEAHAIIHDGTGGRRGIDDFARAFFGINDGDWGQSTYTFDDVVRTLNGVYPHDWAAFLTDRLQRTGGGAPLAGFTRSGYRLEYRETPNPFHAALMKTRKELQLPFSLGLTIGKDARVTAVQWQGPAWQAGVTVGQTILAVDGQAYSDDVIKRSITAAKGGSAPIRLNVRRGEAVNDVSISYNGGLRFPVFVKTGKGDGALDALLKERP